MTSNDHRRVVVVTGASAGVGRAVARAFGSEGARVGLLARGRAGLEGARREVEDAGGEALVLPTDVADAAAVNQAARRVEEELGPIDVWVNDAMVTVLSPVAELAAEEIRRVTDVTYLGTVNGTLAALRRMRQRNRGTIVQVGSALAYRGIPYQAAYCAAKHAVRGFTESLRTELRHDGSAIRVTMVQLPALNTPQFDWLRNKLPARAQPVPPIHQPEIAAEAVLWASRHDRREVLVGGATVKTIWGNKVAPWLADRVLARQGLRKQQTNEPEAATRPHNLWEPVDDAPGTDHGAHGRFGKRALRRSWQVWATTHRPQLAAALLGIGALAASVYRLRR